MYKFKRARSPFFDPIIKFSNGTFLVRPYSYGNAFNIDASQVKEMCRKGLLPHLYDGETYLILIDERDKGEGGRFTQPRSKYAPPLFPRWRCKKNERRFGKPPSEVNWSSTSDNPKK
jgi:hypothetical protein